MVGSSMGAAVIWAYIELFGEERLARAVFVDQVQAVTLACVSMSRARSTPDGSAMSILECCRRRCRTWHPTGSWAVRAATTSPHWRDCRPLLDVKFEAVAEGNLKGCLSRPLGPGMEEALKAETLRADPDALGRLMADHTQVLASAACQAVQIIRKHARSTVLMPCR